MLSGTEPHPHARAVLSPAVPPEGQPSHAYLFHGPAGTGKRAVAHAFAAELLADGAPDPVTTRERVAREAHPDLTWVRRSGARELLVGDIEQPVVAAATRTPFEATRRVFVLEQVDVLQEAAANRLLKTLEEPASYVHLILLTDRLGEVLPTIISRCQLVRFDPLPAETIAAQLAGVDPGTALACARLSLGDASRAELISGGDGAKLRAEAEALATAARTGALATKPWDAILKRAYRAGGRARDEVLEAFESERELLARKEVRRAKTEAEEQGRRVERRVRGAQLDLGLQLTGLWFRDLAAVAYDAEDQVLNVDRMEALRAQATGLDPARARAAVELVEDTRERMRLFVGEELACEALAYRLARELSAER